LNKGALTLVDCIVDGNSVVISPAGDGFGGGIHNSGTLTVIACAITNNYVYGATWPFGGSGNGGGIHTVGNCVISNSTVAHNRAGGGYGVKFFETSGYGGGGYGGGIYSGAGSLRLEASTVAFNSAKGGDGMSGGGYSAGGGIIGMNPVISNCTISQNTAYGGFPGGGSQGGQIKSGGIVDLKCSTVVFGDSMFAAGIMASTVKVQNCIVAGNGDGSTGDVAGVVISLGYNLIKGLSAPPSATDIVGLDPILGPLQNNGGSTLTHLPLGGSPAIDAGISGGLLTDQRGFPRIRDNLTFTNALGGDGTDIGAVELEDAVRPSRATNYVVNLNASGPGSLSQAILDANAAGGGAIHFSNVVGTIYLSGRLPTLTPGVEIRGPGRDLITIDGEFKPIFLGAAKLVSGLSIQRGLPAFEGNFRIVDCAIVNSRPAVRTFGEIELLSSTVSDSVGFNGAFRVSGKAIIRTCVFTNNQLITVCPSREGSVLTPRFRPRPQEGEEIGTRVCAGNQSI